MGLDSQTLIPSREKTTGPVRGGKKRTRHERRPRQARTAAPVYESPENATDKNSNTTIIKII